MAVFAQSQPYGLTEEALRFQPEDVEVAWRSSEEWLARLTSNARFVVTIESALYIQFDQPDLVIATVQAVDDAVRVPTSWDNPAVATPVG